MEKVVCPYCHREMSRGSVHVGAGLNCYNYTCTCGTVAAFLKDSSGKKIESYNVSDIRYEET